MSKKNSLEDVYRFIPKNKNKNSCWIWQGSKDTGGYGLFRLEGTLWKAHRLIFLLHNRGELEEKDFICHKCDTPSCVNPNHLFKGNQSLNRKDMYKKGRGNTSDKLAKKLSRSLANEIRESTGTHQSIANRYNIDRSMVGKIKSGVCWGG